MKPIIFLSHGGADSSVAERVAGSLRDARFRVRLDRLDLRLGESFVGFMENALSECDYFLLLWSEAAAASPWVKLEWESALHRAVTESQHFVLVARLRDLPVPRLLTPRLHVDLFPDFEAGLDTLHSMLKSDESARCMGARPLVNPLCSLDDDSSGVTIYLSSQLWAKTFPMRVRLEQPVGALVERIATMLELPREIDAGGRVGCRFSYELVHDKRRLERDAGLNTQGVAENSLLWVETTMEPFAARRPIEGAMATVVFRSSDSLDVLRTGKRLLLERVAAVGLGRS